MTDGPKMNTINSRDFVEEADLWKNRNLYGSSLERHSPIRIGLDAQTEEFSGPLQRIPFPLMIRPAFTWHHAHLASPKFKM